MPLPSKEARERMIAACVREISERAEAFERHVWAKQRDAKPVAGEAAKAPEPVVDGDDARAFAWLNPYTGNVIFHYNGCWYQVTPGYRPVSVSVATGRSSDLLRLGLQALPDAQLKELRSSIAP